MLGTQARQAAQAASIVSERARIAGQKANLIGSAATLEQAKTGLDRQNSLLQTKDVSQSEFDRAKLKLDELQAQQNAAKLTLEAAELNLKVLEHNLEAADAQIKQAQETLGYTTIVSPLDGVITRINAKAGEMVVTGMMNNPGTKILEVGDLSQILAVAQVDEADVGKLEKGQTAKVFIDAYSDKELKGRRDCRDQPVITIDPDDAREIGLRKAVGARRSAILTQFLIESITLCLIGGIAGIGFGQLQTVAIANIPQVKMDLARIPLWAIGISFGFSDLVGVVFGMVPAIKASRLDPIEALRHE